jgi:membrane protein YqaA with SNARE-associated domain
MYLLLDPRAWLIVVAFTVLGLVGNLALYQVGKKGVDSIRERFPSITPERWERVKRLYDNYGGWVLLLSGVPVLGSMLTTAAGAFDVRLFTFVVFVFISKLVRNWLIIVIPLEIYLLTVG